MARKIFVTYKYADELVNSLEVENTTARTYVDELQKMLEGKEHINKGEKDDADLSAFKDDTIQTILGEKIFDSSLTIIMISKGMLDPMIPEADQWIPWEISYSLRKKSRGGKSSRPNALLAITLPDEAGLYDYYIIDASCPHCKSRTLRTSKLFKIMKDNMFNIKQPEYTECTHHNSGSRVYSGSSSYIYSVKWSDFVINPERYIDLAIGIGENIDSYNITKQLP
ncbi:hypothetical protein ELS24_17530 [Achromobacter spanius]|uniref:TIR domain-containing protein n=1 Tax=Achromobacter spanius TaxID=217203 RepID=UPI000F8F962C|nr:TIR domain-containing protein [Achromobacter spanius]AZS80098.1 hypothetical protein ELS24_17530 [Achromobacter spanius]